MQLCVRKKKGVFIALSLEIELFECSITAILLNIHNNTRFSLQKNRCSHSWLLKGSNMGKWLSCGFFIRAFALQKWQRNFQGESSPAVKKKIRNSRSSSSSSGSTRQKKGGQYDYLTDTWCVLLYCCADWSTWWRQNSWWCIKGSFFPVWKLDVDEDEDNEWHKVGHFSLCQRLWLDEKNVNFSPLFI